MNEITIERNIDVVTAEILTLSSQAKQMALTYAIELGKRLVEAKGMLEHGEWGDWLANKVNFSQSTANNFMKLYNEYGLEQNTINGSNSQPVGNLSVSQALALIAIPPMEREEFIEENNVSELSKRELQELIRQRDELQRANEEKDRQLEMLDNLKAKAEFNDKEAARARQKAEQLASELLSLQATAEKADAEKKKLNKQLKELKKNPEVPKEVIDRITKEIKEKADKSTEEKVSEETKKIKAQLQDAENAKQEAEHNAQLLKKKIAELEKQLKLNQPEIADFKRAFNTTQKQLAELKAALNKVESVDPDTAKNFKTAINQLLQQNCIL